MQAPINEGQLQHLFMSSLSHPERFQTPADAFANTRARRWMPGTVCRLGVTDLLANRRPSGCGVFAIGVGVTVSAVYVAGSFLRCFLPRQSACSAAVRLV